MQQKTRSQHTGNCPLLAEHLQAHHAADLRALARRCYEPYYAHLWRPGAMEQYLTATYAAERLQHELTDPNIQYHRWWLQDRPIAMTKRHLRCDRDELTNASYLERIYLAPEAFGQQIGRRILAVHIDAATHEGRDWLWLQCMKNAAKVIASYSAVGFTPWFDTALDMNGVLDGERGMIGMRCRLSRDPPQAPR